jgi:hypothetical protein
VKNRIVTLLLLTLGFCSAGFSQTPAPPVQHFVMSTTAGSFGGSAVSIASTGVQLTTSVSAVYEFISNPADSSKPRVGSGLVNYTFAASSVLPASLKKKLLIDFSNYNLTLQGGAGVMSESNGVGMPRTSHVVGNAAIYGSRPLPGGHTQIGLGYKWLFGKGGGLVKVPMGTLNFTF